MKPADVFWVGVPTVVIAHNTWAALTGREQLSDAMDRYRLVTPLMEVGIWLTAAHLTRRIPVWADPWAWLFRLIHSNHPALLAIPAATVAGAYALLSCVEDPTCDFGGCDE